VLSRICQLIRRGLYDVDSLYTHSYFDSRGLQSYPNKPMQQTKKSSN